MNAVANTTRAHEHNKQSRQASGVSTQRLNEHDLTGRAGSSVVFDWQASMQCAAKGLLLSESAHRYVNHSGLTYPWHTGPAHGIC